MEVWPMRLPFSIKVWLHGCSAVCKVKGKFFSDFGQASFKIISLFSNSMCLWGTVIHWCLLESCLVLNSTISISVKSRVLFVCLFPVALFLFTCLAHAICTEGGWQGLSIQFENNCNTLYKLLSMLMIEGPFLVVTTRCVYTAI